MARAHAKTPPPDFELSQLQAPLRRAAPPQDMLAEFRCDTPAQVHALLCELRDTAGAVVLSAPDGVSLRATLWTVDPDRKRLSFDVEASDRDLPSLVAGNECTAVAYLASAKLQFDVDHLMLVHGARGTALQAPMPGTIYRFQRRDSFRVRPPERVATAVLLRHPGFPEMRLALRVLDVSVGGCSLQLPPDVPPLPLGIEVEGAELRLDANTRIATGLRLQHASSLAPQAEGLRVGCEWLDMDPEDQRALQRHVDQLQRRRRLLARE